MLARISDPKSVLKRSLDALTAALENADGPDLLSDKWSIIDMVKPRSWFRVINRKAGANYLKEKNLWFQQLIFLINFGDVKFF